MGFTAIRVGAASTEQFELTILIGVLKNLSWVGFRGAWDYADSRTKADGSDYARHFSYEFPQILLTDTSSGVDDG